MANSWPLSSRRGGGDEEEGGGRLSALFVRGKGRRGGDSIALKGVGREENKNLVLFYNLSNLLQCAKMSNYCFLHLINRNQ